MFIRNDKRFSIDAPREIDGVRYPHFRDPTLREQLGIIEIVDPVAPEDFFDDLYYVTYQDEAPFTIWTKKPQEQIDRSLAIKAKEVAQRYLDSTDHLFTVDRYDELSKEVGTRKADLLLARKEARAIIRAYRTNYPEI